MAEVLWSDLERALAYACSELGEKLTLNEAASTVGTVKAFNGAQVLAPGTSLAAVETHVLSVHPNIGKITS